MAIIPVKPGEMAKLLFRPAELQSELVALKGLAERFLDAKTFSLTGLVDDIRGLETRAQGTMTVEIPEDRPILTRPSIGEFEPEHKRTRRTVYATISGKWELEALQHNLRHRRRANKKASPTLVIAFVGLASTKITVFDHASDEAVTCWQMELGDEESPGCYFHTYTPPSCGFPVPRHPNMFPTPMSAIGFTLGELFQDEWEKTVSAGGDSPNRWRSIQKKRLQKLLEWKRSLIKETNTSPWVAIRSAKPPEDLFLHADD